MLKLPLRKRLSVKLTENIAHKVPSYYNNYYFCSVLVKEGGVSNARKYN
jgi:hypothetical protein